MDRTAHYREQAERCTRLAGGGIDPLSRERLLEMAGENTALPTRLLPKSCATPLTIAAEPMDNEEPEGALDESIGIYAIRPSVATLSADIGAQLGKAVAEVGLCKLLATSDPSTPHKAMLPSLLAAL